MEKSCPCSYYGAKENYNNIICVIIMQKPISERKALKGFTQEISIKTSHLSEMRMMESASRYL